MKPGYFDKEGQPLDLMGWAKLVEDKEYSIVEQTTIGPYRVLTTWLGLDHNFLDGGSPLIFETMIFADDHEHFDGETWRYSTLAEAEEGHKVACTLVTTRIDA